ncbi:saccharopine dehydrogenase NADP-binding domain-containing protein [Paenibacillus rigui]|uniref:Saccharopine dehydrogenase n=1 Tax=Paenibacillus rigui TaxID=554312 RepID=A0A229UH19_9BACL|nr:saccharopine dehydrogenase NADP-binding domain-containing protein [Paenibacillus rigui]OXM82682.1 saccharopine dehydrogenase [Paenibacillus rigui]
MKDHIIVVGGYGKVGHIICEELANRWPGKVVAAGRSLEKAERFSFETGGKVKAMQFDVRHIPEPGFFERTRLVIMCLDQADISFVRACLESGTRYADISADDEFLRKVETLHGLAQHSRTAAWLSVGLSPGLTNVMAAHAHHMLDRTDRIDISMLSGLRDSHGKGAIEWTIDNLARPFRHTFEGKQVVRHNFSDGRTIDFGQTFGRWKAYRFNFSDQHSLGRTSGIANISTRLCFDSRLLNQSLFALQATGLNRLLRNKSVSNATVELFARIRMGREFIAVKVDAYGVLQGKEAHVELFASGKNESVITGMATAYVSSRLYHEADLPDGVYHLDQQENFGCLASSLREWVSIRTAVNGKFME